MVAEGRPKRRQDTCVLEHILPNRLVTVKKAVVPLRDNVEGLIESLQRQRDCQRDHDHRQCAAASAAIEQLPDDKVACSEAQPLPAGVPAGPRIATGSHHQAAGELAGDQQQHGQIDPVPMDRPGIPPLHQAPAECQQQPEDNQQQPLPLVHIDRFERNEHGQDKQRCQDTSQQSTAIGSLRMLFPKSLHE